MRTFDASASKHCFQHVFQTSASRVMMEQFLECCDAVLWCICYMFACVSSILWCLVSGMQVLWCGSVAWCSTTTMWCGLACVFGVFCVLHRKRVLHLHRVVQPGLHICTSTNKLIRVCIYTYIRMKVWWMQAIVVDALDSPVGQSDVAPPPKVPLPTFTTSNRPCF